MIANEKEFDEALKKLGDLYEEGKEQVNKVAFGLSYAERRKAITRTNEILREMRNLSAVTMQKLHFKTDN